ncbi:MAG: alpha/beta fold hydrolase [Acidimicrobiales bacterium]
MDAVRYREVEERLWEYFNLQPTEQMVSLPTTGTDVRVQETGDGPPVLMVHGGAVNGSSWAPLAAELPQFRCLMVDRPGCGLSPPIGTTLQTIDELVSFAEELVPAILDGLDLERAHVICTSLGGFFGFHGASAHPERYNRLVGIGSIFGSPMDGIPFIMRVGTIGPMPKLMARMPANRQVVRSMLRQIGLKDALRAGRIAAEFEDWFLANMKHTDGLLNEATEFPSVINIGGMVPDAIMSPAALGRIVAPTKLIWGEADPMAGADVAKRFTDQLPDAQLELWPNTGHAPWIDNPGRAARSIEEFLGATSRRCR